MQYVPFPTDKADRFAAIEDVSDQIFEEIIPARTTDEAPGIDRGRVRTRLLDFSYYVRGVIKKDNGDPVGENACNAHAKAPDQTSHRDEDKLPFGWLAIVDGPGRGKSFPLSAETTSIGRAADQDVCLNFEDDFISRSAHATIHFGKDRNLVAVRCGEKRNPVLLNGKLLNGTRLLKHNSRITVGQTTLRFFAIEDLGEFWSAEAIKE